MCLSTITKRYRRRDDKIIFAYHLFRIRNKRRTSLYSYDGKYFQYPIDTILTADALCKGKRPHLRKAEGGEDKYIPYFHSFMFEWQARNYFTSWTLDGFHCELRRVRAYEVTVDGIQEGAEVIVHRKMYIPKGRNYLVCRK